MFRLNRCLGGAAVLAALALAAPAPAQGPAKKGDDRPTVEVVFCLDTTGSMSGLINAAKQKIWTICNQIAAGRPTPKLKVGLVAYRDRGDAYVTRIHDLTDDLDAIHGHLMGFQAQGGGDFPESVNQALHEAVAKVNWTKDNKALRIIFLVGDAPPQMGYKDDVKYTETCQLAVKRDIIINSIQCGPHAETKKYWQDICRLAEGSYVQIDAQGGPVVHIETPFDKDLAKINSDLVGTIVVFGDKKEREAGKGKAAKAKGLSKADAAERAGFAGATGGIKASYDLIDNIKAGKVKLADVKDDQLPEELRKMNLKERDEYLKKLDQKRTELTTKAAELNKKRNEFLAQKAKEAAAKGQQDSFDGQVLRIIQTQARRVNIQYGAEEQKKK
jgi:Mg-chelatase subunit ChlD